jgi:hypothetical protein
MLPCVISQTIGEIIDKMIRKVLDKNKHLFRAAHSLCLHVDQKQLLYAIKSEYMSGPLRLGFYDLLIALHLESHATTM